MPILANIVRHSAIMRAGRAINLPLTDTNVAQAAGLDWNVEKVNLYTSDLMGVDSHRAIKRADSGAILGVVGKAYEPVQNADMFGWLRNVAGVNAATVMRAGERDGGATVWALAQIPDLDISIGKDISQGQMLFTTSHDGGGAVRIQPFMLRQVCTNGLRMMAAGTMKGTLSTGYSVRHTSGVHDSLRSIADAYARTLKDFSATREAYVAMAEKRASADTLAALINAAWPVKAEADETERASTMRRNREFAINRIHRSYTCQVEGTAGSVFAALQAVTEYVDHDATKKDDSTFGSAYFGAGDEAKGRAWGAALALV